MRIYHGIQEFGKIAYPVVTSGIFDGVHLGHQKIISKVKNLASSKNGETVLLTFWPHPRTVLNPQQPVKLLSTFEEKAGHLESLGVDHLIRIPFTTEFSQMSSEDFLRKILVEKIGTRQLVIGYDHRFGKNREGSFQYLSENSHKYGFEVVEISRKDVDHLAVSSTQIRKHILNHQIHLANKLLGRNYEFSGVVTKGQQIGRKIGFPTANIEINESYKLIPSDGAYAVRINWDETWWPGMMNIGVKPTMGEMPRTIEVHIFDFDQDVYGKRLKVEVVQQIRTETKFSDIDQLVKQLHQDSQVALKVLAKL